ncbi:hypothetical protein LJC15_05610 [Desulfovibrio sp. OttesenSCG-928-G11]|nr:hypothetical protein [Desulfovibrio sp. OttesenSCG-928-G11]
MGETSKTAQMAEFVSAEIFKYLGWERVGGTDVNWECVNDVHNRATHPADAVYQYLEPYQNKMTYVLCDFKSYAKSSITKSSIEEALKNLNDSLTCAKVSPDWSEKYRFTEKPSDVKAMLFIYNHDGEFQRDFSELLLSATKKLSIDPGNIIYVMDPSKILYFLNIALNMKLLRGEEEPKLPSIDKCGYFYPEMTNMNLFHDTSRLPLTIETMGGSTHILRYGNEDGGDIVGLDVYTPIAGDNAGYFLYLLDYLRKYNCLQENKKVRIFMPFSCESASINLDRAKKIFTENVDKDLKDKRDANINYSHMHTIFSHQQFSLEIGMRSHHE